MLKHLKAMSAALSSCSMSLFAPRKGVHADVANQLCKLLKSTYLRKLQHPDIVVIVVLPADQLVSGGVSSKRISVVDCLHTHLTCSLQYEKAALMSC